MEIFKREVLQLGRGVSEHVLEGHLLPVAGDLQPVALHQVTGFDKIQFEVALHRIPVVSPVVELTALLLLEEYAVILQDSDHISD